MTSPEDPRQAAAELAGRNLRIARERKGMSQEQVAAAMRAAGWAEWRQKTVSKAESGGRDVTFPEAARLVEILGTTLDRLTWRQGEEAAVALVETALIRVREAWRGASDSALQLAAVLAGAESAVRGAMAGKYRRARDLAGALETEIAESSVESAFSDGLARFEEGDV